MKVRDYLVRRQKQALRLLECAFSSNKIPHAYLLSGEAGIPLKEIALFLAQSLLCDHPNPLADETCLSCRRLRSFSYQDFLLLDGSAGTIKKEAVQNLSSLFSRTPLEEKGIMIYIIHLAENMTAEAVNALLKFLEEPKSTTYAILTSENTSRILPTILSRCEEVRFRLAPREELIYEAVFLGAKREDAELLSTLANSGELIVSLSKEESFLKAKEGLHSTIKALSGEKSDIVYNLEREVIPPLKNKDDAKLYLHFLGAYFKSLLLSNKEMSSLPSLKPELFPHSSKDLEILLAAEGELKLGIQPALILEHALRYIAEDVRHGTN